MKSIIKKIFDIAVRYRIDDIVFIIAFTFLIFTLAIYFGW